MDAHWPAGVDYDTLKPFYGEVEAALEPRLTPDLQLAKVNAFASAAGNVRRHAERAPVAITGAMTASIPSVAHLSAPAQTWAVA